LTIPTLREWDRDRRRRGRRGIVPDRSPPLLRRVVGRPNPRSGRGWLLGAAPDQDRGAHQRVDDLDLGARPRRTGAANRYAVSGARWTNERRTAHACNDEIRPRSGHSRGKMPRRARKRSHFGEACEPSDSHCLHHPSATQHACAAVHRGGWSIVRHRRAGRAVRRRPRKSRPPKLSAGLEVGRGKPRVGGFAGSVSMIVILPRAGTASATTSRPDCTRPPSR